MTVTGEAVRANRMDLVSRWADDLAHEIKNPLHAMVINLELVKRRAGLGDAGPVIERAEVVEAELHRVHALIDAMLRLVRPWPDVATTDVDALFADMLPVVHARARIRKLHFEHRPGGDRVRIPPGDLVVILLNLLDNAIEATAAGGSVTTACERDASSVRISVTDTGPGAPPYVHADEIPTPGDAASRGAGLGLAITTHLAQQAGGTLSLEPATGREGTVATVALPRAGAA